MNHRYRHLPVYEGQPGMAALINRIGDLCMERSTVKEDGSLTDAQPIQPSELLKIIAGDFS